MNCYVKNYFFPFFVFGVLCFLENAENARKGNIKSQKQRKKLKWSNYRTISLGATIVYNKYCGKIISSKGSPYVDI